MNSTTVSPANQLPLALPPQLPNEYRDAKIGVIQTRLTGEMQALKKCWRQFDELPKVSVQSNLDTLVMGEHLRSELLATVNLTMNTLDQLKTSISIWTAYALTLQDDVVESQSIDRFIDGLGIETVDFQNLDF
jgi:hypothetical protein